MLVMELEHGYTYSHGGDSKCQLIYKRSEISLNTGVAFDHAARCAPTPMRRNRFQLPRACNVFFFHFALYFVL